MGKGEDSRPPRPVSSAPLLNRAKSGTEGTSNSKDEINEQQDFTVSKDDSFHSLDHLEENENACDLEVDDEGDNDEDDNGTDENQNVEEPKFGMTFTSEEDICAYYKQYGKQVGFGVMTQRSKREAGESVRYLTLGCSRGGKARTSTSNVSKPRPTTKTECQAKINAMLVDGSLRVTTVELAHNHPLSPRKSRFFRCNRKLDDLVKRKLELNDRAGIRMNKNFNSLVVEAGGFENLQFIEKDCRNFIDKARHLRFGKGGAKALCNYFDRMRDMNDSFYAVMDLDDDSRLRNVF